VAVALIEQDGSVGHWNRAAALLFGVDRADAIGRSALDVVTLADMPDELRGALRGTAVTPLSGRCDGRDGTPVAWWAYPLNEPWPGVGLVVADLGGMQAAGASIVAASPGFAGADKLAVHDPAGRLAAMLPQMSPHDTQLVAGELLSAGYPVLEAATRLMVAPVPYFGPARRAPWHAGGRPSAGGGSWGARSVAPPGQQAVPSGHYGERYLDRGGSRERLDFLSEVGQQLNTALDLDETIMQFTTLAVPRFADFTSTYLRAQICDGEGFPSGPPDARTVMLRVWVAHDDEPGRWDDVVPLGERMTLPPQTPFFQCMATGEPVLVPFIDGDTETAIAAQLDSTDIRQLIRRRSLLVLPLIARGMVLGFMVMMRREDRPRFDPLDLATAMDLAGQAALALENARLYHHQQRMATTLQEAMLPQGNATFPGIEIAARYLPGTLLGKVGGDWYDTIKLPGGRVALVVGDVMGHGINSVAMMGQLRIAIQTLACLDLPPGVVLRKLDDLAQRLGDHYLATCLYVVYDPVAQVCQLANAGHVPPVLVDPDGRSELLDLPSGAPIGMGGVPFETVFVPVAAGTHLVVCTDGLVEKRGRDIGEGLAALCERVRMPAADIEEACDAALGAVTEVDRADDIALLMARLRGLPRDAVATWEIPLDPREARHARHLTVQTVTAWGLGELADVAELLVSEVVTNALRHSHYRPITLRLMNAGALVCEVTDDSHEMPGLIRSGPDREAGRGLWLVSRLARSWGTSRTAEGKTVWFEMALPGKDLPG